MPPSFPVLDTHTGGEITRIVLAADIGLTGNCPLEHLKRLRRPLDWIRTSLTSEPRGSEYAVGAVVTPPEGQQSPGSIVFFNNVGYLGMCGHGLIGVVEALRYQHLMTPGQYQFVTPAGTVHVTLQPDRHVSFTGVPSRCYRRDVTVTCADGTSVVGDIAYGGNWFFLAPDDGIQTEPIEHLMAKTRRIRDALEQAMIVGADGAAIDHVELYCPLPEIPTDAIGTARVGADPFETRRVGARNFVLCPGGHYDRSPCGTGTSAKLACLAARGELAPREEWIQESITGSQFRASYESEGDGVRVQINGRAHVIAETVQIYDPDDPLRLGIKERAQ